MYSIRTHDQVQSKHEDDAEAKFWGSYGRRAHCGHSTVPTPRLAHSSSRHMTDECHCSEKVRQIVDRAMLQGSPVGQCRTLCGTAWSVLHKPLRAPNSRSNGRISYSDGRHIGSNCHACTCLHRNSFVQPQPLLITLFSRPSLSCRIALLTNARPRTLQRTGLTPGHQQRPKGSERRDAVLQRSASCRAVPSPCSTLVAL